MKTMINTQMEEAIYFNLKYVHLMKNINILLKDAIVLKQHINFLESGNIPEGFFIGDEPCRN